MSKDHVAGLAIQIPEDMLRQVIIQEVANALPNKDEIVRQVVREAVTQKDKRGYRGETIFGERVKAAIRDLCTKVFDQWLDDNKEEIRTRLLHELEKNKARKLKAIVEKLASGLSTVYVSNIKLDFGDGDGSF